MSSHLATITRRDADAWDGTPRYSCELRLLWDDEGAPQSVVVAYGLGCSPIAARNRARQIGGLAMQARWAQGIQEGIFSDVTEVAA